MPIINIEGTAEQKTYGVSELNRHSRLLLEKQFQQIRVSGEVSNLSKPASGHIYFKLKDPKAQIQCAFFKNKSRKLNFDIEEGLEIIVVATVSLYEARGDYQLIVDNIELSGEGVLQQQFEALKKKLASEGLFDDKYKKPIPQLPQQIGIITSETGAALQDILTTLKRRFCAIPICLYPSQVQGEQATQQLVKRIKLANRHNQCDVIILARGGGSLEDLWPFNAEPLAYAIFNSRIPIISGVGHETDVTLADYCADFRAATPTAAADSATPRVDEVCYHLNQRMIYLKQLIASALKQKQHQCIHLTERLRAPSNLIHQKQLHVDALRARAYHALNQRLKMHLQRHQKLQQNLNRLNPVINVKDQQHRLLQLKNNLNQLIQDRLTNRQQQFKKLCQTLHIASPLATVDRGYSLSQDDNKQLITSSQQTKLNQKIWVRLKKGQLHCQIIGKNDHE